MNSSSDCLSYRAKVENGGEILQDSQTQVFNQRHASASRNFLTKETKSQNPKESEEEMNNNRKMEWDKQLDY